MLSKYQLQTAFINEYRGPRYLQGNHYKGTLFSTLCLLNSLWFRTIIIQFSTFPTPIAVGSSFSIRKQLLSVQEAAFISIGSSFQQQEIQLLVVGSSFQQWEAAFSSKKQLLAVGSCFQHQEAAFSSRKQFLAVRSSFQQLEAAFSSRKQF